MNNRGTHEMMSMGVCVAFYFLSLLSFCAHETNFYTKEKKPKSSQLLNRAQKC